MSLSPGLLTGDALVRIVSLTAFVVLALAAIAPAQDKEPEIITRLKKAKVDGPFTLIVTLQVKKGEEKAMLEAAKPCVAATRKEKGCVAYELHQDLEDPTKFVFFEKWKSPKDLAAHFEEEHTKKLIGVIGKIIEGTPTFTIHKLAE
jgi:quinol monooxygenase YgiN